METLVTLRGRVAQVLEDAGATKWTAEALAAAIRLALDAYTEQVPHRAVVTVTLSAAGREIDIGGVAYRDVERVWWAYDAARPAYPPHWRDFEVWPGDVLYIDDGATPAAGDVVRLWVTTDHTLDGLDDATETTFPDRHGALLALGAAGFAAAAREVTVLEQPNLNDWAPRNLHAWADRQLTRFYSRLDEIAAREAVLLAGIAEMPALDRWDAGDGW